MGAEGADCAPVDLRELRAEIGNPRVVRKVLKSYNAYLAEQARQLSEAFLVGNVAEVRRIAHAIRGGAAVLHAHPLISIADSFEHNAVPHPGTEVEDLLRTLEKTVETTLLAIRESALE